MDSNERRETLHKAALARLESPPEKRREINSLLISHNEAGDDWAVWIGLDSHDPILDTYGFVIGTGETRNAAVACAVAAMEDVVDRLQAPPGLIEERLLRS